MGLSLIDCYQLELNLLLKTSTTKFFWADWFLESSTIQCSWDQFTLCLIWYSITGIIFYLLESISLLLWNSWNYGITYYLYHCFGAKDPYSTNGSLRILFHEACWTILNVLGVLLDFWFLNSMLGSLLFILYWVGSWPTLFSVSSSWVLDGRWLSWGLCANLVGMFASGCDASYPCSL